MMNEEQKLFDALSAHRSKIADALEDPSVMGLAGSAEEKYTDQAHFVYELIQNADDAKAEEAKFILFKDKLIFVHNGTRHFSVTDVKNEAVDAKNHTLGDLNAITSYANSSKTDGNSIGRFGLGFKAVLQYTVSPYVYDPVFSFKIIRKIVPVNVSDDCSYRKQNETAFVLPFNHPLRDARVAYEDIFHKLQNLVNPMLFLRNLKKVSYECGNISGEYTKEIEDQESLSDTRAEYLRLTNGNKANISHIWLFSRTTKEEYQYSVGFFVNADGHLEARDLYAFCFFPTKKQTNLGFIINAPFLLTDSREGIKAAVPHNERMIELLADLAADCFEYLRNIGIKCGVRLIDDEIMNLIPYKKEAYIPKDSRSDISFLPFYEKIAGKFRQKELLPSFTDWSTGANAYMANAPVISDLFSNVQLAEITGNPDAKWIFTSKGWEAIYRTRDGRADYLRSVMQNSYFTDTKMIEQITAKFIEMQDKEWLYSLYDFIIDTDNRIKACRTVPVFLDKNGKAAAAYDEFDNEILFIEDEDSRGYTTISAELLHNPVTKKLAERLELKTPELKDKIYNKILKKKTLNSKTDFRSFLMYYIELIDHDEDPWQFIFDIHDLSFISGVSEDGLTNSICAANELYYPSEDLQYYFEGAGDVLFVNIEEYQQYLKKKEYKYLREFLEAVGVKTDVAIQSRQYDQSEVEKVFGTDWPAYTKYRKWIDYYIDNDDLVLNRIADNADFKLSVLLWNKLWNQFENNNYGARPPICGVYQYFFKSSKSKAFEGFGARKLKNTSWLKTKTGAFCSPAEISVQELSYDYNISAPGAKSLLLFLGIKDSHPEYKNLDDSVRQKLERYDVLEKSGLLSLSDEKIRQLIQLANSSSENSSTADPDDQQNSGHSTEEEILKDLGKRVQKRKQLPPQPEKPKEVSDEDSDEITKATVDYSKKIEQVKQKCEDEISKLAQIEEAQKKAGESEKYSYAWFSSLLQLEALAGIDDNAHSREVSISFAKVKREEKATRTLILSEPDKNIPQVMEELVDIPVELIFDEGVSKRLIIEAANVQSYSLRIKVKQSDLLETIDFSNVKQVKITAQNPTFLTRELQQQFQEFSQDPYNFDDNYNMQQNLCSNISFIFGPPGTGKTTYLAQKTLIPVILKKNARILVLAPTNKAADVLVSKIMQVMDYDNSYENWLIRYGVTLDEKIEKSGIFHGKDLNIESLKKCIVVTTMARLPYDYFIGSNGKFSYLRDIKWDYIVVDEASMVPLVQMVYMLYKTEPKQFFIAGDPFQIEPTTTVSDWKNENIYKMVHLEEFSETAETVPHLYEIKLLTTQYRSIASIGELFSQLTYKGVLKHARENADARPLNIERYLDYQSLNLIRFPVSQYESIYRAKRLKLSSYQVYSALFVFEFSTYIAKALARENSDQEKFRIGVIAPYGAQAGLINKLIASADIPENIELTSGTIHGFQGDECDIVIALFNPPPKISTNSEMFLNRQNIINVAISRARDYLFVLVPDDNAENVQNLWLINRLKKLIVQDLHTEMKSGELESLLFGNQSYLEENTFATGHQTVNVYGLPERRYEIRSEDTAVDVQVHGSFYYAPFAKADEEDRPLTLEEITDEAVGQQVSHKSFGIGTVKSCSEKICEVDFSGVLHRFAFPGCFRQFLLAQNEEFKEKIDMLL